MAAGQLGGEAFGLGEPGVGVGVRERSAQAGVDCFAVGLGQMITNVPPLVGLMPISA